MSEDRGPVGKYSIDSHAGRVILPATGSEEHLVDVANWEVSEDNTEAFAESFYTGRDRNEWVRTQAVLVHHAANTYNSNAISVSTVASTGVPPAERHLGYLFDYFLNYVGATSLPTLIGFAGGEVECTVVLQGGCDLAVDLPRPEVLGEAIRVFLGEHGLAVPDPPRPEAAKAEHHTHAGPSAQTAETLVHLTTYVGDAAQVTDLRLITNGRSRVRARSLRLLDDATGRLLGTFADGLLFLEDERDRDRVLALLARQEVEATCPVVDPRVAPDIPWQHDVPPNVRFHRHAGGWNLHAGEVSREPFATYNPTRDTLWVEDSRLVSAALKALHRQGLDVTEFGLPRDPWGLDDEIPYADLWGRERRSNELDEDDTVPLRHSVRSLIPANILGDTVHWISGDKPRSKGGQWFGLMEKHVRERDALFPVNVPTTEIGQCRLCGDLAGVFTTPISTEPLAYCQTCLATARVGLVEDRLRAAAALAELGRHEFDGEPMLVAQLDSLHVDPGAPVDALTIDRLLVLRFGVARKGVAWTLLLEAAGFAEGGLRTGRGTLIRSRDGHLCHSLRERAVCDFLHQHTIEHDREPMYPADPDYNRHGLRRADWALADGTLVELWGMPNDPAYAAKMIEKRQLAQRHGLRLIELVGKDLPELPKIFRPWMSADHGSGWSWSPLLVASSTPGRAKRHDVKGDIRGRNAFNAQVRRERLDRCAEAVRLQHQGLGRQDIGRELGLSEDTVKMLLRDGKFYTDPTQDPNRATLARRAADARLQNLTRTQFMETARLTKSKAFECWRDAAVLHESPDEEPFQG